MFSSPALRVRNQQENRESSILNRKPGVTNSARKPLGDRSVNTKLLGKQSNFPQKDLKSATPKPLKSECINTPSATKSLEILYDYPEWCSDTFSKRNVKDTFEDIFPESLQLTDYDFVKSVLPNTPPLKTDFYFDPMVFEIPQEDLVDRKRSLIISDEDDLDLKQLPVYDIAVPDFD